MLSYEINVPLLPFTTLRVGGPARYFICVKTPVELKEAFLFARSRGLPVFILGGGSNILVDDRGYDGVVVKNEMRGIVFSEKKDDTTEAVVGAGENWDCFVADTVRRGLYGLENLSGIPGTVGAAPIQNIGAYGVEVGECIIQIEVFDPRSGETKILTHDECGFAYRNSIFKTPKGSSLVVVGVCVRLSRKGVLNTSYKDLALYFKEKKIEPTLASVRRAVCAIRAGKFPDIRKTGTAGSFFRNPIVSFEKARALRERFSDMPQFPTEGGVKIPIAWVLDRVLSWKGKRKGTVGMFSNHSLVLVNYGGASAKEIDEFARKIEHDVKEKIGIILEREVAFIN